MKRVHIPSCFTAGIIKGLAEHKDYARHFGSTLGISWHLRTAQELGLVAQNEDGTWEITDLGNTYYSEHNLDRLPNTRAYYWSRDSWDMRPKE